MLKCILTPDAFKPERWLPNNDETAISPILFGFSRGQHFCLGAPLALLEATVMLTLLMRHFDWQLMNGRSSLTELNQNLTIFPRDRMPIQLKRRDCNNT